MAIIVIALCVLILYLLKRTRDYQLFSTTKNVNKTTSSKYKSTPETTNLARVARLILGPCTDLLRDILKRNLAPFNLSKTVKTWVDDLKKKKQNSPLNKQQIALIFPLPTKHYGGDYSDFDISLLYILLRNVCKITPHNNGWGEEPDPTDNSVSANIERIRLTRNKYYGHAADFSLSDLNFIKEWQNIYNITVESEQHTGTLPFYKDAVNNIRTCSMDPEIEAKYIDKLLLIDELCKTVQSHADKIEELLYVIPPNVKDLHERQVIKWREEDDVYSETHTFQVMLNKVRRQPYMTFVGVPGSGKSATIHHIALILQKEGYEVVPIIDISEICRYFDSHNPQVFVIDDVVGVLGLQKQKLETLVDYEKIISDLSRHTKVLMSCREAVFNECYKSFFSNKENVIKMLSSENALNDDDKKDILQKHGLDKDLLSSTLLREASPMFPLLCKLYSKEEKFRNNVERFFTCPGRYISEEFDKMKEQNRLHYASLVLCLLNDNKLSEEIIQDTENTVFCEIKSKALNSCKVRSYTDVFEFVDALSVMEGTYTKLCSSEYTFIHDSVFEIIAHHFGSQFPNLILQFMSSSYIANYVKLQKDEMLELENENKQESENVAVSSWDKNEINTACESLQNDEKETLSAKNSDCMESFDLCIRLREEQYSMFAERLFRDIENMELYDVFMNNVLKHPKVCQAFIEVLKTKSHTELKSLFLSVQKDVSNVVSTGERVREESRKRDIRSREWCRQRLLVNENFIKGRTFSVRVISWVIYYGHNQILQYILKETECELFLSSFNPDLNYSKNYGEMSLAANNSTNLWSFSFFDIDGSISEQQRLLLLSCYNGNLEIVRIFIDYLKRNAIDMWSQYLNSDKMTDDTPLKAACESGHLNVVKELIEAGADVNSHEEYGTPLTLACKYGYMTIVEELLRAGANINPPTEFDTPLTCACENGHMDIVKDLLGAGANVNYQGKRKTPLIAACRGGHVNVVKELLRAGAEVNLNGEFATPLTTACKCGHINLVRQLLGKRADVNPEGVFDSPLIEACRGGYLVELFGIDASKGEYVCIVKELLRAGADVNRQDEFDTPLTAACGGGHMSIVKELLGAGADVNLQGKNDTPLTAACNFGDESIVKELIGAGADVNLEGDNDTPMTAACKGGYESIVKELLRAGAHVNSHSELNNPLTAAINGGYVNLVKELIRTGADVNLQSKIETPLTAAANGEDIGIMMDLIKAGANVNIEGMFKTPLIGACEGGHLSAVKQLLEAGADVNLKGELYTPLISACRGGYLSIVNELLKAGADVNLQGDDDSPLTAASEQGHIDIVKELLQARTDRYSKGQFYKLPITANEDIYMSLRKKRLQTESDFILKYAYCKSLIAACHDGNISVVKKLLNAGTDVNPRGRYYTPLKAACRGEHLNLVKELLEAGADVNQKGNYDTPLTVACEGGHLNIVKELLRTGADVNLQGENSTPLTAACGSGHISVVIELLEAGASVNLPGNCDTPLTAACKSGYMNIARKLLEAGSDVNMQDKEGRNPIYTVVFQNKTFIPAVIRMFNYNSADATISNKYGISALYIALIRNKMCVVKQLLENKNESQMNTLRLHLFECLVNIKRGDVMTDSKDDVVVTRRRVLRMKALGELHIAVLESECKVLKHLLDVGLDVNQLIQFYDAFEVRPLLNAVIDVSLRHRLNRVRILLESGADVNVRVRYREYDSVLDREGVTVLERIRRKMSCLRQDDNMVRRSEWISHKIMLNAVKKRMRRYSR
ncbi:uncharacterized protein LOC134259396 [Saccostrea cucullata]|uniref:uncharacterized protein LOC134259396 n=1 Tax=Saccostrea cuccullata TaxID=36930 RepID=UPI002ED2980C